MIEIKSVLVDDENMSNVSDLGMIRATNGEFLSIREQYENRSGTPMTGFYMFMATHGDVGIVCTADNVNMFRGC